MVNSTLSHAMARREELNSAGCGLCDRDCIKTKKIHGRYDERRDPVSLTRAKATDDPQLRNDEVGAVAMKRGDDESGGTLTAD